MSEELEIIKTTVPIPVQTLRDVIGKTNVLLEVDLTASKEKVNPTQALIYLSNLEIPVDVVFDGEDALDALDAYLRLPTLLRCPRLETMALEMILLVKGLDNDMANWIPDWWMAERQELVDKWCSLVDSMSLYMMTVIEDDSIKDIVDKYPTDETNDTVGINFVHLFENPLFPLVFEKIDESRVKNYTKYFNEYMFKNKNLFYFWARPGNDVFMLQLSMVEQKLCSDEEFGKLLDSLMASLKEAEEA